MYDLIASLNREGLTILMISHDIAASVRDATHILHVGSTAFFGSKEDYVSSETGRLFLLRGKEAKPE